MGITESLVWDRPIRQFDVWEDHPNPLGTAELLEAALRGAAPAAPALAAAPAPALCAGAKALRLRLRIPLGGSLAPRPMGVASERWPEEIRKPLKDS